MTVLILGATGYIGSTLAAELRLKDIVVLTASRGPIKGQAGHRQVDTLRVESLLEAMHGVDTIINCVAGDAVAISEGARCVVEAASRSGIKKIIHMSSMAVYGFDHAMMNEQTPLMGAGNWYAEAKIKAESEMALFAKHGEVIIFRIGCVAGGGSVQWVQRIGDLLHARRIGDLGSMGDGWSNLVALQDVCQAVVQAVYRPHAPGKLDIFNLSAPDSPRWNSYLVDFAQLIGAAPPERISSRMLKFDAYLRAPAVMIYRKVQKILRFLPTWNEAVIPPSLITLFRSAGRLETDYIGANLSIAWTGYEETVRQGAVWYVNERKRSSTA